ncbi:MAG: hypothetical protein U0X87_11900 [Anaerolineales bacterium]
MGKLEDWRIRELRLGKYKVDVAIAPHNAGKQVNRKNAVFLFCLVNQRCEKESKVETVTNVKGQITIPSKIRKQLLRMEHLQIDVNDLTKQIIITPVTREYVRSLRGKYKGKGLMKALMAEHRAQTNS